MAEGITQEGTDSIILDMFAKQVVDMFAKQVVDMLMERIGPMLNRESPNNEAPKGWIDRTELLRQLNIDNSTLFKWEKKGKLVRFGQIEGKIYYLRSDVERAMKNKN